jgi:hypothetical protein
MVFCRMMYCVGGIWFNVKRAFTFVCLRGLSQKYGFELSSFTSSSVGH